MSKSHLLLGTTCPKKQLTTILDDINKLLKIIAGEADRLTRIKDSYQKDGIMNVEDRKYLDEMTERYLTVHSENISGEQNI